MSKNFALPLFGSPCIADSVSHTTCVETNENTFPIPVCPLACTVHAKWCTAQYWRHTQMGTLFVCHPYVYWKMGAYQYVTLDGL